MKSRQAWKLPLCQEPAGAPPKSSPGINASWPIASQLRAIKAAYMLDNDLTVLANGGPTA